MRWWSEAKRSPSSRPSPMSVKVVGTWFDSGVFSSAARGGVDEGRREIDEGEPLLAGE
jgi:hypothetical protein